MNFFAYIVINITFDFGYLPTFGVILDILFSITIIIQVAKHEFHKWLLMLVTTSYQRCPRVLWAWVGRIDERFEFNRRCCSAHSPHLSIIFSTWRLVKLFVKPFETRASFLKLLCQILSCINKSFLGNFGNFCRVNYYLEK